MTRADAINAGGVLMGEWNQQVLYDDNVIKMYVTRAVYWYLKYGRVGRPDRPNLSHAMQYNRYMGDKK